MVRLAAVSLVIFFLSMETACESQLEELRDMWFEAIKKTNESFYRRRDYPDDFRNVVDKLSSIRLKSGYEQRNLFGELRNVMLNNSREKKFGFKFGIFTNFCGPGNVANETVCGVFNGVDECCKSHDRCEHVISKQSDFNSYPNLPKKPLYFTSLSCECDSAFYNCIKRTESVFGDLILSVYSVAQMSCFQLDHKIGMRSALFPNALLMLTILVVLEKCTKFDEYSLSKSF